MRARLWKLCLSTCAVAALLVATADQATAIGYYNLPGNFCQWMGYGNGAGHHSCLVLGPSNCQGACAPNEVRLECPPQPCYGGYGVGYGGGYGPGYYAPPQNYRQAEPQSIQPQPTPAAMRPQILR